MVKVLLPPNHISFLYPKLSDYSFVHWLKNKVNLKKNKVVKTDLFTIWGLEADPRISCLVGSVASVIHLAHIRSYVSCLNCYVYSIIKRRSSVFMFNSFAYVVMKQVSCWFCFTLTLFRETKRTRESYSLNVFILLYHLALKIHNEACL